MEDLLACECHQCVAQRAEFGVELLLQLEKGQAVAIFIHNGVGAAKVLKCFSTVKRTRVHKHTCHGKGEKGNVVQILSLIVEPEGHMMRFGYFFEKVHIHPHRRLVKLILLVLLRRADGIVVKGKHGGIDDRGKALDISGILSVFPGEMGVIAGIGDHVNLTGGKITPIPTSPEEGYFYADRERIVSRINENTRAILLSNPGNPTGVILSREEARLIADIAKEHDLFLIADEVYREFVYNGEITVSMASFEDVQENVILIDSVSKRFSACGARIGAVISRNKEFMAQAMKICQGRLCSATLDQVGAAELYTVGPEYFLAQRDEYRRRRDTVMSKLAQIPGVICKQPEGAFYVMAALPVDDADKFQLWLLEEFQDNGDTVMFAPGEPFYATPGKGKNEIRIAYVLKQADLERAMDLLALGIEAYNKR